MPEKRRARTTGGQAKVQRATTQTTLKDHFQRTNSGTSSIGKEQDSQPEHTDPVAPSPPVADPQPPVQPSRPLKPTRLFPIFTKISSVPERVRDTVINVDDTEVIDITDTSDIDISMELPLSSTYQPSPRSELDHATSRSSSPCPIALNDDCESNTSLPHGGTHLHTYKTSKEKVSNKRDLGLGDVAPFPSSCSQHVRGLQHAYTSGRPPLKRRVFPSSRPSDEGALDFLTKGRQPDDLPSTPLDHIHRSLSPQQCEEYIHSLSRDYTESHPAFARISVHRESPLRPVETWTRRFRPRRANEVLGNEQHAIYLRDWLSALELDLRTCGPEKPVSRGALARENKEKRSSKRIDPRGVKRPRVIRSVAKRRGNKKRRVNSDDDLDDFVVSSDADEEQAEDPPDDSEDEFTFCQRTLARLQGCATTNANEADSIASIPATDINHTASQLQEPAPANFADKLTNALIITGPPGCGKTAAVYACAEELEWEVFEVYPGIGRRNGANLDHLVGDVGRNHIVQTVHRYAPRKTTKLEGQEPKGLRGYLGKSKTGQGTEGQPISVDANSPMREPQSLPQDQEMALTGEATIPEMCHADPDGSRPIVRQSLVLLEEVDILFKEDVGFWPAVIDLIQCCQRPVVMTCNDLGLVPLGDLPLQRVLVFEPCPSTVAATFLQCLSLTEGCLVPHEDLMVLYESTHWMDGIDVPEGTGYPRTEPVPLPDLRRSITQLQMLCAGARHGSTSEMHQGDEAGGHVRRSGGTISAECRVAPMESTVERWRQMRRHSELMSHVDAELCRRPVGMGEGDEEGTEDDEVGYMVVRMGGVEECCRRDELIAEEAIRHSRGEHEGFGTGPIEERIDPGRDFGGRVEYRSRMVEALQEMVGPAARLTVLFLDYIPWVRYMVTVDDILERRACEGKRGGRSTRNSMRTRHTRWVALGDEERRLLLSCGLGGEEEFKYDCI